MPLNRLLESKSDFRIDEKCVQSFDTLKTLLCKTPILSFPDFKKQFILDCDASDYGIGGVLTQLSDDGHEKPIAYYSRSLSKPERRYSTTRKELLALISSINHFRCYLYGTKFLVRTDHVALQWLHNFKEPTGQVARWLEKLAEYDYEIQHRPGRKHSNADAMSRYPLQFEVNAINENEIWIPKMSAKEMRAAQLQDATIKHVLDWLQAGVRPNRESIAGTGSAVHY